MAQTSYTRQQLQQIAAKDAAKNGLGQWFVRQIQQESGFNPGAKSGAGAEGIAQFMPSTAASVGLSNPYDPVSALAAAAQFDASLVKKYGSVQRALSAYNSGNPDAYQDPNFAGGQTYNYVKDILGGASPLAAAAGQNGASAATQAAASPLAKAAAAPPDYRAQLLGIAPAAIGSTVGDTGGFYKKLAQVIQAQNTAPQANESEVQPQRGSAGSAVVAAAKPYLGTPYRYGGNDPQTGIDCSRFVQLTMAKVGVQLPRTTQQQFQQGTAVKLNQMQPGDVIYTEPGKTGPGHAGIYIGNGQVQESPHTGEVNKTIPLQSFLTGGLVGVRRFT